MVWGDPRWRTRSNCFCPPILPFRVGPGAEGGFVDYNEADVPNNGNTHQRKTCQCENTHSIGAAERHSKTINVCTAL